MSPSSPAVAIPANRPPLVDRLCGHALAGFCKGMTSLEAVWSVPWDPARPRIFYVNHASHADSALVWASVPAEERPRLRAVAAVDYWMAGPVRRYLSKRVFHAVLVERRTNGRPGDALERMEAALENGDSLLLFPEGTRSRGNVLLPFRPGLHHVVQRCPWAEVQPVWLENPGRGLPKGTFFPIPLLCRAFFGPLLPVVAGESHEVFLERARSALLALGPSDLSGADRG
ncbi:MAG: 1-acyl-sn-glycerol-3-phosphate acyltransferase [Holophagales bacterium]|nr:1-acyl-sn-glycerol-3-phosphate acyltransferase [Holophagales bacterium]MBK9965221.1 1-acyl-sn-glycerol-3-phosphate acyltransferase [Holophagales bacterium]